MEYYTVKMNKKQLYTTTYNYLAYICSFGLLFVFTLECNLYESTDHLFCSLLSLQSLIATGTQQCIKSSQMNSFTEMLM